MSVFLEKEEKYKCLFRKREIHVCLFRKRGEIHVCLFCLGEEHVDLPH